jgi:hypothetical protein
MSRKPALKRMADKKFDNIIFLSFSDSKIPVFKEVRNKEWTLFGEDDQYPDYLLELYNKSAKHNAIVGGKVNYIFGEGLKTEDPATTSWLNKFNSAGESGNDVCKKSLVDIEAFGGFYWQIIFNQIGGIQDIYHLEFKNVRSNHNNTEFYYKRNWKDRKEEVKRFPAFDVDSPRTSIFFFSEYRPGVDTYCLPGFIGSANWIEADIEVSKHTLTNAKTGFSASKMINFFNGEPEEDHKKEIEKRLSEKYGGAEGKKLAITFNNTPDKAPTILDLGASDLTKEDFTHVDEMISQNIYAGHQITSPMLFGIQEPGKLGSHNELRISYEIFKNTYARNKQIQFERVINDFARFKGLAGEIKLQEIDPVGIDFSDQVIIQVAPADWVMDKMGIDATKYHLPPAGTKTISEDPSNPTGKPAVVPAQQANQIAVNENIKNLTAKQHQQLLRIIRQYSKGQLTQAQATTLLKTSLGLSDEEITSMLGVNQHGFSTDFSEEDVADMFSECGTSREGFEIITSKKVLFQSDQELVQFELNFSHALNEFLFDDDSGNDVSIPDEVRRKISEIKKATKKIPKIAIKYSYEVQPGVGPAVIEGTRPFCRKMIQLDRLYSRQDIESISERLGYSVWNRRGGFWNNNGTIEPHCRHLWKSNIVVKKS